MIRKLAACCVTLIAFSGLRADEKADDWKGLKGTWKVEKAVLRGQDATDMFKSVVLTIEEGKYTVGFGDVQDKGTITTEAAKKPKQMTITGTEGPSKGKTLTAVYEVDGDTLKICYALDGKQPPAALESKAGTATLLVEYKRDKN